MTSAERRANWIVAAAVVSLIVHVVAMVYARPKVMTRMAFGAQRFVRVAPMRVTKNVPRPAPVKIDVIADVRPARDMPAMVSEATPEVQEQGMPTVEAKPLAPPELTDLPKDLPPPAAEAHPVFDAAPVRLDAMVSAKLPMARIETPSADRLMPSSMPSAPPAGLSVTTAKTLPAAGVDPNSVFLPSVLPASAPMLSPAVSAEAVEPPKPVELPQTVLPKVDEQVVAAEKAAVKQLVNAPTAKELSKVVLATVTKAEAGDWTYFRVWLGDRRKLRPVPKDFVLLIDASGSIGGERMASIRKAAKRILRSATNSGDRFNLVAFRDRYSYAFRNWQECNQFAFDQAENWLNNLAAHGRTDVFDTIASVLTLPRNPQRPLIALVVTDGDANSGVSDTAEILTKFTELNDGLISVYMYGVKSSANRELIDVLTHGNRGDSLITDGWWWQAGDRLDDLTCRFRDPLLTDLRLVFAAATRATALPQRLRNLYRGQELSFVGRVPSGTREIAFSLQGLNGAEAYEGYYRLSLDGVATEASLPAVWYAEQQLDLKLRKE